MSNNTSFRHSVNMAYQERQCVIIIGLTGKTGSGCTTVSKILQKENFESLNLSTPKDHDFNNSNERKYAVVHRYMRQDGKWQPFSVISASSIIFSFVLECGWDAFYDYIGSIQDKILSHERLLEDLDKKVKPLFSAYNQFCGNITKEKSFFHYISTLDEYDLKIHDFIVKTLPEWRDTFRDVLKDHIINYDEPKERKAALYVYIMQTIGNNIRCSGNPYDSEHKHKYIYKVAERMDFTIKFLLTKPNNVHRICIDAIRNSYEAFYFKDKYSAFYLVSVNTDEDERKRRLSNYDIAELNSLDYIETADDESSADKIFYHQNMKECLSISDIHLFNPRKEAAGKTEFLTEQVLKYLCLMLHPGLVTPTAIERCMQTAYVAKLNSGCLSRQVGAVITDQDYSIKAIGWNDVPSGQIPCNLRCTIDYATNCDGESFSDYERQDERFNQCLIAVHNAVNDELKETGLAYAYCFKDVYNAVTGKKNQVHTRALHAEENAFLQISKYGGSGIKGGKLFSTASPCELCSKKAFQLGIREIYYIDPYPGISENHILHFGTKFRPSLNLYYGAIGNAYVNLYTPRIPLKDELELLTGIEPGTVIKQKKEAEEDNKTGK